MLTQDGTYGLQLDSNAINDMREKFEKRYGKDETRGVPWSRAKVLFGGDEALKEAIREGDAIVTEDSGKRYVTWREITTGKETGSMHRRRVI